jgi:hypothetical protein
MTPQRFNQLARLHWRAIKTKGTTMTNQINTPFVLNTAYDKLVQFGINPEYYWVKQLRQLAQSWANVNLTDRVAQLSTERDLLLRTVGELKEQVREQSIKLATYEIECDCPDLSDSNRRAINTHHGDKQNQGSGKV